MNVVRKVKSWWHNTFSPPDASVTVDKPKEVTQTEVRLPKVKDGVVVTPKVTRRRAKKILD